MIRVDFQVACASCTPCSPLQCLGTRSLAHCHRALDVCPCCRKLLLQQIVSTGHSQVRCCRARNDYLISRAAKRGCFKRGRFPIWTCPSFFVLFCPFWDFPDFCGIFPICTGMVRGFSRFWSGDFPDLSFSSFSTY